VKKRQATAIGVGCGFALAVAAHLSYWYLPRERAAKPSVRAGQLLEAPGARAALWVPFPHQNLAVLERRVGDLRRWADLFAPQSSRSRSLPSFGPFVVPPARELVVVESENGVEVELTVYPVVARLARLAGSLARNPWLSGGDVRPAGRAGRVEWRGDRWLLITATSSLPASSESPSRSARPGSPALARAHLASPVWLLPAGEYGLSRGPDGLELRSGRPRDRPLPLPPAGEPAPVAWVIERHGRRDLRATVVWPDEGAMPPFPASAVFHRGRLKHPRLPGEEMLRLTGNRPARGRAGGIEVRALGTLELQRGLALAGDLGSRFAADRDRLVEAGVVPSGLAPAAQRVAARFRGLPLGNLLGVDPGFWSTALGALEECQISALEVWRRPEGVRWRLCAALPPPADPASN